MTTGLPSNFFQTIDDMQDAREAGLTEGGFRTGIELACAVICVKCKEEIPLMDITVNGERVHSVTRDGTQFVGVVCEATDIRKAAERGEA